MDLAAFRLKLTERLFNEMAEKKLPATTGDYDRLFDDYAFNGRSDGFLSELFSRIFIIALQISLALEYQEL